MMPSINLETPCPACRMARILIFATALFLIFENRVPAQNPNADANSEDSTKTERPGPGYDAPLGARDPFLPPGRGLGQMKQDDLETTLQLLRSAITVSIVVFGDSPDSGFAFVNGAKVGVGDEVAATVTGKKIALPLKKLLKNPPGIVLTYKNQEFNVYSNQ